MADAPDNGIYWHVTPATRTKSILREGVMPGRRPQWKNPFGARQGQKGFIYLISDFREAVRWAARMEWDLENAPVDIIKVQVRGDTQPDDHMENMIYGNTWFCTRSGVAPEDVLAVHRLTLEMKRALVAGTLVEPVADGENGAEASSSPKP